MNLYLDTEFNGFGGELISLALVPEFRLIRSLDCPFGDEFYEVVEFELPAVDWVAKNVIPVLGKTPLERGDFIDAIHGYLRWLPSEDFIVIADWPEDIAHFCKLLCWDGGNQLRFFPSFRLVDSGKLNSTIPHNALEDARALRNWYWHYKQR